MLTGKEKSSLEKTDPPDWFEPTLARLTDDYFSDPDWIYERKLDGMRCLVFKTQYGVSLLSRNKKENNAIFPELVEAFSAMKNVFVGDGEIVTFKNKLSSFSRLQERINKERPSQQLIKRVPVVIYLFDLLYLDGYDISPLSLKSRKSILKRELKFTDPVRYCSHINESGESFFHDACIKGWEGIIAKNKNKPYIKGRTSNWLKFKCDHRQEFVIGGYTDPQGRRVGFGSILIGYYENEKLCYTGKVGTGFSENLLKELHKKMRALHKADNPFNESIKRENVHFIKPELVAEVGFTEWTSDNKLRHPRFIGLRNDKEASDVVKESN